MPRSQKPLNERIADADMRGNSALADFNALVESGYPENGPKAQKLLQRGQFWLDRYNKLTGNA